MAFWLSFSILRHATCLSTNSCCRITHTQTHTHTHQILMSLMSADQTTMQKKHPFFLIIGPWSKILPTSGAMYQSTRRHISAELNLLQNIRSLRSPDCTVFRVLLCIAVRDPFGIILMMMMIIILIIIIIIIITYSMEQSSSWEGNWFCS